MPVITIKPDEISFEDNNKNILETILDQNLNLPHGCKNGLCGACKCKVISGEIRLDEYSKAVLTDEEKGQGYTLLCKAYANNNIELHIPEILNNYPIKVLPAKVIRLDKINNVAIIKMKVPQKQKFEFFAGQYIDIMLDGKNRSYSIANAYREDGEVEVHVKYHKDGIFSEFVWHDLKEGDLLRFKGPLGNFKLRKSKDPVIFVCTGTGFAPIKAILEEFTKNKDSRDIYLYWGNRLATDFYLLQQIDRWKNTIDLNVILCLSQEIKPGFETGYVTTQIKNKFSDLTGFEVYACGNLKMIEDVYKLCTQQLNLKKGRFYSDAFTPSV